MRILVVEYVTGGGLAGLTLVPTLAMEGAAMLQAVVSDFVALGIAEVVTLRDHRLDIPLVAAEQRVVTPGRFGELFDLCLAACDAALVIAPETGGVLAALTERVEAARVLNLGSTSAAVRVAGDKLATIERVAAAGVAVPPTWYVSKPAEVVSLGFPIVLKPRDGVGALGLRLVRDAGRLDACWAEASSETTSAGLVAQRYVPGHHASVSLLCSGADAYPLSLNAQAIVEGERFEYQGGAVPLEHPSMDRAFETAISAARAVPGLRGYVGVDLVLGDDPIVMEINPRLTTAYTGLRQAVDVNLAGLIIDAAHRRFPATVPVMRRVRFTAAGDVT